MGSYSEKLRDPRWQKKRLEILNRDKFTCKLCKDKETELHIHHKKYDGDPWNVANEFLVTYCKHCHSVIEFLKKTEMVLVKIDKVRYEDGRIHVSAKDTKGRIVFFTIYEDGEVEHKITFHDAESLKCILKKLK